MLRSTSWSGRARRALTRLTVLLAAVSIAPALSGAHVASAAVAERSTMSIDSFFATYNNKYVDIDGAYGAQCTDLFNAYHEYVVGGSYVRMAYSGGAKDLWSTTNSADVESRYIRIAKTSTARKGDVAVWGGYSSGYTYSDYGHVAIVTATTTGSASSVPIFSQNPGPAHYMSLSKTGLLGYLRPKKFAVFSTAAPKVSGTAKVGSTLTATAGTWSVSSLTFKYQWYASGTAVSGATGSTFAPTSSQVGKTMKVVVTASRSGYNTATATSNTTGAVAPGTFSTSGTPTITGTPLIGSTLTASRPAWSPTPTTVSYQWLANGATITGATGSTFVVTDAQEGKTLSVRETAAKSGYTSSVLTSASTAAVASSTPLDATPTPVISGEPVVDSTLTVDAGDWEPAPVALGYQWLRNGVAISGATGTSYVLGQADIDAQISVSVTGTKSGYAKTTTTSEPTSAVTAGSITATTPTISGTAQYGETLTAEAGAWAPEDVTLNYQWLRDGSAVSGATGQTYALGSADIGHTLAVTVTGVETGYRTETRASSPTSTVTSLPMDHPRPTISGTAKQGSTLTAVTTGWTSGVTKSYQWLRNGTAISGATGSTYAVNEKDIGKTLVVRVTGSGTGYTTVSETSSSTATVTSLLGDRLSADSKLYNGSALYSPNGVYKLIQQSDGNLVLYNISSTARAVWSSKTTGKGAAYVRMQSDGNLVQYTSAGKAVWSTATNGKGGTYVRVQSDGNVVIYTSAGKAVWATNTVGK
ncbi:CHAP domain-containing protein [Nocardioides sp. GY 10127]|uniref:CHAP domain-containing protein n=1 Tax=Nocardioides sp. GY 10127 TaxID=2569762 RepID=UPI0010A91C7A|nr:CHAP domain-containing protein [Nocardioides sp. GY 10127]TIC79456.1 CHAP domain-containing protein [Nocardioides sp. GY 10127]